MFLASENIDFTGLSHVFLLGGGEHSVRFLLVGAGEGTRTPTPKAPDPKSGASANFATPARLL